MDSLTPLLGPLSVVLVALVAGWFGLRERRAEVDKPDWAGYSKTLEGRIDRQDSKIDELFILVGQLRTELESEKRLSSVVIRYLRVVLAWALDRLPPGTQIPPPPAEISAELADYIEWSQQ